MQRHRYVDRQHTAPQQMKQHRQHRDRIARSCCACHQRCRPSRTPAAAPRGRWQVMAGMPVPGQPPQVRGHDRIRYANQPIVPPDHRARSRGGLELGRVPRLAPLHRAAVDYDRSTVRSASEEVRCMRDQFARLVAPGQPKRLRGDADHCRVEIQRHHVIAFHPRLEADVPAGRGRPPQAAFSGGPRRRVSGNAVVCARQVLSAWTLAWATRVVQGGALVRVTTLWWSG